MSAVSNSVMPRSIALWMTLREVSRSVRWPKLLQPRPTAETRRPELPRLRICMGLSCSDVLKDCGVRRCPSQVAIRPGRSRQRGEGPAQRRPRKPSKQLAVDDEAGSLGNMVIELPRGDIRLMRLPIDAR